jgi:dUTPase
MSVIKFIPLSDSAVIPKESDVDENCYNIRIAHDCEIKPGQFKKVYTDFAIETKFGYKARIVPSYESTFMNCIEIQSGPVFRGFQGNVGILVQNYGQYSFVLKKGDVFGQILVHKYLNFK